MHWNIRVFKLKDSKGYGIKKIHYDDKGNIKFYDEDNMVYGETLDEVKEYVSWINESLNKAIVDEEKIKF